MFELKPQTTQIDSSTIDGNVEFVPLSTAVFLRYKCQLSFLFDKIINISDNFRIKCLSNSNICAVF